MAQKIVLYDRIDYEWYGCWKDVCPANGYRIASAAEIPLTGLPQSLTRKTPALCMINSGDLYCFSYVMADFHREDGRVFDRQPFVARFDHRNETAIAGFVQHLQSENGRRSSYDPNVTSGLLTVTSGSGLVKCGKYWLRPTQGTFHNFASQMPEEQKAFQSSVSLLDRLRRSS